MTSPLLIIVFLLVILIAFFIYLTLNSQLQKRFRQNPLIQTLVSDMTVSMLERIEKIVVSDRNPIKVITESATVFEDCIISHCASVFFQYEHMRLLRSARERRLMAKAIAKELRQNVMTETAKKHSVRYSDCKLKSKCRKGADGNNLCFLVSVSCYIANERYVCAKSW